MSNPFFSPTSSLSKNELFSFFEIDQINELPKEVDISWHTLPYSFCKQNELLPFHFEDSLCQVATTDPLNLDLLNKLRILLKKNIKLVYCPKETLLTSIEKVFQKDRKKTEHVIASLSSGEESQNASFTFDLLEEDVSEAPAIRLLNSILQEAYEQKASDIHFESEVKALCIRYRIDGVLQDRHILEKTHQSALFTRLKILSNLDISEHRRPQDGRFRLKVGQNKLDFRLSSIPTSHGERMVLRLLDPSKMDLNFQNLGLDEETKQKLIPLIQKTEGLFLVTGPTGSGKTTTLYSLIKEIQKASLNIMTIEDPIEYELAHIAQMNVHPEIGLSFSKGLRHLLRQDPDVILIGEIRDFETAQIAIQAALTGHLVLSTLHTNDAPSSITRLIEMGIEPYLLSSSLIGVLAQRLVRKICPKCKSSKELSQDKQLHLASLDKTYYGKGCTFCFDAGYQGRTGLYELLEMSEPIKQATLHTKEGISLSQIAIEEGLQTLYHQGIKKVLNGQTSLEEVLRVAVVNKEGENL